MLALINAWNNAWILIIPLLTLWLTRTVRIIRSKGKKGESKIELSKWEKRLFPALQASIWSPMVLSIYLPLVMGTIWFSAGLVLYFFGLAFAVMAWFSFMTTPIDKPVTKGIYRFSRNPMNFGIFWAHIGISIVCSSFIFMLIAYLFIILTRFFATTQERSSLKKYGNEYLEYMNRTPRWIGLPKQKKTINSDVHELPSVTNPKSNT